MPDTSAIDKFFQFEQQMLDSAKRFCRTNVSIAAKCAEAAGINPSLFGIDVRTVGNILNFADANPEDGEEFPGLLLASSELPDGKTYVIITVMRYANRGTDAGQFLYKLNTADEVLKKITGTSSNVLLA